MIIAILIILPVLWLIYAALEGVKEGYLYNYRDENDLAYGKDLHPLFTFQRVAVIAIAAIPLLIPGKWYFAPIALVGLALVFPLVHDGYYYLTRNKIDETIYPQGFFTDRSTSTAKISLSRIQRIYAAMAGCIAYGVYVSLLIR